MSTVKIDNVIIGEGKPKICVPLVSVTKEEIIEEAKYVNSLPADIVELRIDFFNYCLDNEKIKDLLMELRKILSKPIIFTFRSLNEGGNTEISPNEYKKLLLYVANTGLVDIIDIELFTGDDIINEIVAHAHRCGIKVIMSNHDFEKTPIKYEIVARLVKMQSMNADIVKIAVMPNCVEDLLILLSATNEFNSQFAQVPVVTMSMSKLGVLSRVAGEFIGSAMTFGAGRESSAPGQIQAEELRDVLDILHNSTEDGN